MFFFKRRVLRVSEALEGGEGEVPPPLGASSLCLAAVPRTAGARLNGICICMGGISGAVNFVWEISRFKLAAKFPIQNPGSSAKFTAAKFTAANLTWHEIPLPPCKRKNF